MKHFDASSIIHAWDNYPIAQFPSLWNWLAAEFKNGEHAISKVAYEEVVRRSPDCGDWLKSLSVKRIALSASALTMASSIKSDIGIVGDEYHSKGVGENDLLIIATAKSSGAVLITDEGRQNNLPNEIKKCRIPAVCNLPNVLVSTMNFIELVRASGVVFS